MTGSHPVGPVPEGGPGVEAAPGRVEGVLVAATIVGGLLLLIFPVNVRVLDILIAVNLAAAFSSVLLASTSGRASELSIFPRLIVLLTLFRLILNVASTRMILLEGTDFGGLIIRAIGETAIQDNLIVGIVILAILVLVQFIVITRGAERIAEVAARFQVEVAPMLIGAIESRAQSRQISRAETDREYAAVQRDIEFFGAMDGASKYVRGETLAGVVILFVNLAGGAVLALRTMATQEGIEPMGLLSAYSLLIVGDALVAILPSLLLATATGILLTRTTAPPRSGDGLGPAEERGQVVRLASLAGGTVGLVVFLLGVSIGSHGLPLIALGALGVGLALWAVRSWKEPAPATIPSVEVAGSPRDRLYRCPAFILQLGKGGLDTLAQNSAVLSREIGDLRRRITGELGLQAPGVQIMVDDRGPVPAGMAHIVRDGVVVGKKVLPRTSGPVPEGELPPVERALLELVDRTVRQHLHEFLGHDALAEILSEVREHSPALHDAVQSLDRRRLLAVLRNLLRDEISIADRPTVLEAYLHFEGSCRNTARLTERVRTRLQRQITGPHMNREGSLTVLRFARRLDQELISSLRAGKGFLAIPPARLQRFITVLTAQVEALEARKVHAVLLTKPVLRRHIRELVRPYFPDLPVLSAQEVCREARLECAGTLEIDD